MLSLISPLFDWQTQMAERADKLKEQVAEMIASSTFRGQHERLHLIDTLERLCLDHLFEEEISAALSQIEAAGVSDCDIGTVALWFCLLRKHRYRVSPGNKLKKRPFSEKKQYPFPFQKETREFQIFMHGCVLYMPCISWSDLIAYLKVRKTPLKVY